MIWVVIKKGYVINRVKWDGKKAMKHDGDSIKHDVNEHIGIGDWYEESEDTFYAPRTKPNDPNMPKELEDMWNPKDLSDISNNLL